MSLLDQFLDASIVPSLGRAGFRRHARTFVANDLAVDLTGKVVLVTGANSGLGFATAHRLAALHAEVWLLCRDPQRGADALARLKAELPQSNAHLAALDVSLLADVRRFANGFDRPVDVLVNNAGVMPPARTTTPEGHELTFATNVLGPFALTRLLLPKLKARAGRVVTVSSGGMYTQSLELPRLRGDGRYDGVTAYAQTKRAEVLLNELWAARVPEVMFAAMHPGWVDTPALRVSLPRFYRWTKALLRSPEEGADTSVWLAACPRIAQMSGLFWFDRTIAPTHVFPVIRESPEERTQLWKFVSEASAC